MQTIVDEIEEYVQGLDEDELRGIGLKIKNHKKYKLPSAYVNAIYGIAEEIKDMKYKDEISSIAPVETEKYKDVECLDLVDEETDDEGTVEFLDHSYSETKEDSQEESVQYECIEESTEVSNPNRRLRHVHRRRITDPNNIDFDLEWQERLRAYLIRYNELQLKDDCDEFLAVEPANSRNPQNLMWSLICPIYNCNTKLTVSCSFNPYPNFRASNFLKHLDLHKKWLKEKNSLKTNIES